MKLSITRSNVRGDTWLVSDRPGIGLQIDENKLGRYPHQPKTILGNFHADGSVAL